MKQESRPPLRWCLLALVVSPAFAGSGVVGTAADDRPNILLIVAEDMSARVGAFGDKLANTPSIDALAKQGVRYANAFTASGVCAPSRSALITGVHPISLGTHQMRPARECPIPISRVTRRCRPRR